MPRLKLDKSEFDPDALDVDVEDQPRYDGEIPPTGTKVPARVKKIWWTYTANQDPMFKVLTVGEEEADEYEGLPIWDNLAFVPGAAFRYKPFLEAFGITLDEVFKKTFVDDEDNIGLPVTKVGSFKPGSDDGLTVILVKKEKYDGRWQARPDAYLPWDGEPEEEDEEEEEERPARRKPRAKATNSKPASRHRRRDPDEDEEEEEEELEDEAEEEEDEEEEDEAPTSRRRPAARRSSARSRSAPAKGKRGKRDENGEPPF